MEITYGRLDAVPTEALLEMLNDARISRHMPLWGEFTPEGVREWAAAKTSQLDEHGYGPQAVWVDGRFAGWAGIQHEDYGPDLAVVLAPWAWGAGRRIASELLAQADDAGLAEVFIALPPSRLADAVVARAGFSRVVDDADGFVLYRRARASPLISEGARLR